MNASASAIPREDEVQSKIRKIWQFGRIARFVCAVIFAFGLVGGLALLLILVPTYVPKPNSGNGGFFAVMRSLLTSPQSRVCMFLVAGTVISVWLAAVYQLYRLFGNLASRAIYIPENVRRVRNVGLLMLTASALGIVIPAALVVARNLIDPSVPIDPDRLFPSLTNLFGNFASAGLILLASWIMDVGLYEKDHAEALKREADLVI